VNTQCQYLPWRFSKIESLDVYTNLEPKSPVSESEEVYLARQKSIEAMVDGEDPNQTTESNCDSNTESESVSAVRPSLGIDVLTILDPEKRAMATRLMQIDATPECNLSYNGSNKMSQLLNTGSSGTEPPNYTYENVRTWSSRIEGGLFTRDKIFVPINHQNAHWLTMCMNMRRKKIFL